MSFVKHGIALKNCDGAKGYACVFPHVTSAHNPAQQKEPMGAAKNVLVTLRRRLVISRLNPKVKLKAKGHPKGNQKHPVFW